MSFEGFKKNIKQMKEILRELYIFTNQYNQIKNLETNSSVAINNKEKKLLESGIIALTNQLRILNKTVPDLMEGVGFYQGLKGESEGDREKDKNKKRKKGKLTNVDYTPDKKSGRVSLVIDKKDRKKFIENLSKSNLSINKLKKKYSVKPSQSYFGKPNAYAKLSNHFFRDISKKLVAKGYFKNLNKDLRKINSPFVVGTYVSMILFTMSLVFIGSFFLFLILLFFNINFFDMFNFITPVEESFLIRFVKVFWIIFVLPFISGTLMYFYPSSEGKNMGSKIDQELPFVVIHMAAISTSGISPISIFKIILKTEDYKYTNKEIRKLMNLVNFHGNDLVSALKIIANTSPSKKLKELLNGISTTLTSGGDMHNFLDKHGESLLFEHKTKREKYIKTSETFMDIYIAIVIAAPMILLMLFVIMGSTGALSNFMGLSTDVMSMLIIFAIVVLNIGFLVFLHLKQPNF